MGALPADERHLETILEHDRELAPVPFKEGEQRVIAASPAKSILRPVVLAYQSNWSNPPSRIA